VVLTPLVGGRGMAQSWSVMHVARPSRRRCSSSWAARLPMWDWTPQGHIGAQLVARLLALPGEAGVYEVGEGGVDEVGPPAGRAPGQGPVDALGHELDGVAELGDVLGQRAHCGGLTPR